MTQERPDDLPRTPAKTFPARSPAPWALSFIAAASLATCWFTSERIEDWAFHIDTRFGPQHAYFTDLELRSAHHVLRRLDGRNADGTLAHQCCEAIRMKTERPEKLLLRWCDEATNQCRTEDVDLRGLLPYELRDREIYVVFVNGRMEIHLIDDKAEAGPDEVPSWMYAHVRRHVLIYPK